MPNHCLCRQQFFLSRGTLRHPQASCEMSSLQCVLGLPQDLILVGHAQLLLMWRSSDSILSCLDGKTPHPISRREVSDPMEKTYFCLLLFAISSFLSVPRARDHRWGRDIEWLFYCTFCISLVSQSVNLSLPSWTRPWYMYELFHLGQ